jgi:hypothetical protein
MWILQRTLDRPAGGLTEAGCDDRRGLQESALSDRHKLVIRYADVFLTDPHRPIDTLRAEMLQHFTAEEIVELTAGLALFMGFSKIAVVLGTAPESMPTWCCGLPTPPLPSPPGGGIEGSIVPLRAEDLTRGQPRGDRNRSARRRSWVSARGRVLRATPMPSIGARRRCRCRAAPPRPRSDHRWQRLSAAPAMVS